MAIQHLNSHISVRAYDKTVDAGYIEDSRKPRGTEIDAIERMRWGDPIPASDRIGELRSLGFKRCCRCNQYKEPAAFSTYKRKGRDTEYLHTYCKHCRAEMDKTKRWSNVVPLEVYPRRIG